MKNNELSSKGSLIGATGVTPKERKAFYELFESAANPVEELDAKGVEATLTHQKNVALAAVSVAKELETKRGWKGMGKERTRTVIFCAAMLHDIGKCGEHSDVFFSEKKYKGKECRATIETHSKESYELIKRLGIDDLNKIVTLANKEHYLGLALFSPDDKSAVEDVAKVALQHHERCNGEGYPRGLTDKDISQPAKIIALLDSLEALTSPDRPYREPETPGKAITQLACTEESFDPTVVSTTKKWIKKRRLPKPSL